jgi:hypothetical protein
MIGVLASALVVAWPLTAALSMPEAIRIRVVSILLTIVACVAVAFSPSPRQRWVVGLLAAASTVAAMLMIGTHLRAQGVCLARDERGDIVVIGTEYTAEGLVYRSHNSSLPVSEMLNDTGQSADLLWTHESIARCRLLVGWLGPLAIPFLAAAAALIAARTRGSYALVAPVTSVQAPTPAGTPAAIATRLRYDAFISYRRLDRERAERLTEELEARGFRVAIDFRDFRPNEPVLVEMERCILESRFVLCVITANYASSGFTTEEALMTRLLDLTERRNRIVPLIFERVPLPAWLAGLVGVNFMSDAQIDPVEKLTTLLKIQEERGLTP